MRYFEEYASNTVAAGGNQSRFLNTDPGEQCGRVYYRLTAGGEYRYSFLFSNTVDSTFSDGSFSHADYVCDAWELTQLRVGLVKDCAMDRATEPAVWHPVTVGGQTHCTVQPAAFFATDPLTLSAEAGDYLCVEIAYLGRELPCHPEAQIPAFRLRDGRFVPSTDLPFPGMIGCDRPVRHRVAFLGDSITQGIGVVPNSYRHWNALTAAALGNTDSYWNLGLGFARAYDAALDGSWLFKAKQADAVVICFGVNDLSRGRTADQIVQDLHTVITALRAAGCRLILQTVPPFDYTDEVAARWAAVNSAICGHLAGEVDAVLDIVPLLGDPAAPHRAPFGGHPNEEGCARWAQALIPVLRACLE